MPALTLLQHHPRTLLLTAAAVPFALAAVADDVRLRLQRVTAGCDELTGLPRRQALTDRGEQLLARRSDVLVLFCDGDAFKQINDRADADTPAVNGRRPGRPGTHLTAPDPAHGLQAGGQR
jgi:GGDEF domain-containing protein